MIHDSHAIRLNELPDELGPLVSLCERHAIHGAQLDSDGVLLIGNQPWVAPEAFAVRIYPLVVDSAYASFHTNTGIEIPEIYRSLLSATNGCFALGISLCGIPPSSLGDTPLLDRARLQCHDLSAANCHWKHEYEVDVSLFHFGGRDFSSIENSGYFIDGSGEICAFLPDGTNVGRWNSFTSFMADEIRAAEEFDLKQRPSDNNSLATNHDG